VFFGGDAGEKKVQIGKSKRKGGEKKKGEGTIGGGLVSSWGRREKRW